VLNISQIICEAPGVVQYALMAGMVGPAFIGTGRNDGVFIKNMHFGFFFCILP
jgi:hypothetical protein